MYRGKRKYKHLGLAFKEHVVRERIKGEVGIQRLGVIYGVSPKEIRLWTKRFLAGEPLKMKMGRPRKHPVDAQAESETTPAKLRAENKQLKAELAYKNELIKLLEERGRVKKRPIRTHPKIKRAALGRRSLPLGRNLPEWLLSLPPAGGKRRQRRSRARIVH